ncbi:MAG: hypothetical protein F4Y00_00875, partial [Bacteroidetes bacterium SB0662_bin_6]|nr:hypothetical protein [Gammaproteobacteria bacterium]MYE03520.1 hypothetical protein [Bacteroidetes bacterium SB0662_bin_6]
MDNTSTALKAIQDKLLRHFNSLAAVRRRSGFPIFALEHCLDSAELKRINTLLREHQKTRPPLTISYWLVWVVYSSEAGYRYTGDEYWPSFENQTPNWQYHDRVKIKSWFKKFHRSFNGVTPSGPWAEHFSIIAWPITNALLPIDLQRQFARLLYDLRFRLATASLDAGSIGRLLAAHASHASSRFQAFLEQEELTGQIVAAFLRGESADAEDLIYPPTLNRIITDLERVRSSRVWLKETRRVASDRFQGIGRGYFRPAYMLHSTRKEKPTLPDALRFAVRPYLFLRYDGSNQWSLLLQLKSLRPIAAESTELRRFLDRTRCRLIGSSDWEPTGWLLSGNRKGMLNSWPDTNSPLIQFEQSNPLMDHLLESEFRLSPGPIWLFRIGSDGIARYVASKSIRPATCYIVVTADNFPNEQTELAPCTLACSGIHAFRLSVPNHVSSDTTARFLKVGLDVTRTIRVWPAGLPGRGWDGEGSSEWLSTESPYFGIDPDHQVDKLSFRLDDEPKCVVATEALGGPTFVRLPPLQAGSHSLTVEALRSPDLNSTVTTPPAKGFLKLEVRDPEPWTPGITSHPGLVVSADPFDASLDVLWRNELNLSVNGPEAYTVRVNAKLYNSDGSEILSDVVATSMALPITPEKWHQVFAKFLTNENRAWKYLEAVSCVLEISGDSLGTCLLKFDHEPAPELSSNLVYGKLVMRPLC